jgi:hypothetical protein
MLNLAVMDCPLNHVKSGKMLVSSYQVHSFFFQIELITPKSGTLYIPHFGSNWSTSLVNKPPRTQFPLNWILTQQLQERATE